MSDELPPLKDPFAIADDERDARARRTPVPRGPAELPDPFASRVVVETTPAPVATPRTARRPALSDEPMRRASPTPAGAPAPATLVPAEPAPPRAAQATLAVPGFADLTGREMTMAATPAEGATPSPSGWLLGAEPTLLTGREMTMAATPADGWTPAPGAPAPAGEPTLLTGREMTMPATPAEGSTPAPSAPGTDPGRAALHTPRTMPGIPPMGVRQARATPTPGRPRTGLRSDTATSDDAWHYQGRIGPFTGQQWGDWEIGGILGEGGMGTVYRAKQTSLNRRVALKVLAPHLAADLKLLQRFQLEARTASLLASPNVVQVFAAGEWEDNHFFVMEFVEGRDLYDVMKSRAADGKPFTPEEAADIVVQAARGLAEAGRIGVVHRDIKPPNLMVTSDHLVKVADFGIVKVMGESALTMTGQAVGTPSYVSPEQGRGESTIDQRSDLYSLGVVFYELLTGKKPFEGSTPNAIIYQHCFGEPRLPRELNPVIDEKYQAVVLKCLQKKPENRYQNAGELIRDLEDIRSGRMLASALANYRLGTGAAEAKRENMSWAQRHLLVLVSAIVLVAFAAGLGLWWLTELSREAYVRREAQRTRAGELFNILKDLDSPRSIPDKVENSLREYATLPDADQRRVGLWQNKLERVATLLTSLKALNAGEIPLALRRKAPGELLSYQELVGTGDAQVVTWKERLDDLAKRERDLRQRLREVDQQVDLTQSVVDGVSPLVHQLGVMAGEDDPLVVRVAARLREFSARRDRFIADLAVLDQDGAVITDTTRARLQSELGELGRMIGTQDERIARWGVRLTSNAERIAQIRQRLRRLDQFELPPVAVQFDLDKDFAALKELVDDNDPELRGWKAKLAATAAEIESLRKRLARLDQPTLLSVGEIEPLARLLEALRVLVGEGDEKLLAWQKQHKAAVARHAELQAALTRLDRREPLTLDEQRLLAVARELLAGVGGLSEEQDATYLRRLNDERIQTTARVERLQALDRVTPFTASLRKDLEDYTAQAGEDHPEVKRWNAKRERIAQQSARLTALDRAAPVPDDAATALAALVQEVGESDDDVSRWHAKLRRIANVVLALAPLDRAEPLPADTASTLAEFAALVGEEDLRYRQWRAKFERVAAVKLALAGALAAYGHAPAVAAAMHQDHQALIALVSLRDPQVAAWAPRLAHLDGPGRPSWAADAGRDDFGLWAELALAPGLRQRFRFVPAGTFTMGSPEQEPGRDADEVQVRVTIGKAFWLADTECTQALWQQVMATTPSRDRGLDRPVERVSWSDTQVLLTRLRGLYSAPLRLPSEAEWEYAARAGGEGSFSSARSDAVGIATVAWFAANSGGASKAVKLRFPNPIGLYDLHGNVWEWCQDRYAPYATVPVSDPIGRDGESHVARGGSWGDPLDAMRVANRAALSGGLRSAYVGLRLACEVEWPINGDGEVAADPTVAPDEIPPPIAAPAPTP